MDSADSLFNFILNYLAPALLGAGWWLHKLHTKRQDSLEAAVGGIGSRVNNLEASKISYEQCMALIDKQETRIMDRLKSVDGKLDRLIERASQGE